MILRRKIPHYIILLIFTIAIAGFVYAHNKVVVVPLGSDTAQRIIVQSDQGVVSPNSTKSRIAICPEGTQVVGGGGGSNAANSNTRLIESRPHVTSSLESWFLEVANDSSNIGEFVVAYAVCLGNPTGN